MASAITRSSTALLRLRFVALVDDIYARMTMRPTDKPAREGHFPGTGIALVPPDISTNVLSGLIEAIAAPPYNGKADLPLLAANLQTEVDELFPIAETLQPPRFAEVAEGDIRMTRRRCASRMRRSTSARSCLRII